MASAITQRVRPGMGIEKEKKRQERSESNKERHRDAEKGRRDRERNALAELQRLLQEFNAISSSGGDEDENGGSDDSGGEDATGKARLGLAGAEDSAFTPVSPLTGLQKMDRGQVLQETLTFLRKKNQVLQKKCPEALTDFNSKFSSSYREANRVDDFKLGSAVTQHLAQQKSQSKSDIKAEGSQAQADVYLELDVSLQSYFSEISQSAIGIIDPGINCTVSGLGKPKSGPGNQNKSVLVVKVACKGRECGWSGGVCCGNAGSSGVGRPVDDSKEEISRSPRENTARSPLVKTGAEQKTEVDSDQQIESNQLLITSLADIIRRRSFKIHQLGWKDDGIKMVSVGIFVISKKITPPDRERKECEQLKEKLISAIQTHKQGTS